MNALFRSHAVAFVFFIPFIAMSGIHRLLGLSDAVMAAPAPGEPHSQIYNFVMIAAFYGGMGGFVWHVSEVAKHSSIWMAAKLIALAFLWGGLIWGIY